MVDTTLENSELMKDLLSTLISISGRKTNPRHALYVIDSTIKSLKNEYSFLDTIGINNTLYEEDGEQVTVLKDLDKISQKDFAPALKDIIITLTHKLGDDAGHFFLKELSQKMNDQSVSVMKNIGVDLYLIKLEEEILKMEKTILKEP